MAWNEPNSLDALEKRLPAPMQRSSYAWHRGSACVSIESKIMMQTCKHSGVRNPRAPDLKTDRPNPFQRIIRHHPSGSHFSRSSSGVPIPFLHPLEVSVPSERYPPPHHSFSTRSPPSPACDYYNTLVSEQTDSHGRRAQWRSVFRAAMRRRRPPAKRCKHAV